MALTRMLPSARNGDVNAIHQARVATRRVRAALPIVTRGSKGRKLTKVVSRLTRALGGVREHDVALLTLDELASDASVSREGIDLLRTILREERERLFADMALEIERVNLEKLQRKALAAAHHKVDAQGPALSDAKRLRAVIKRSIRRALALQAAIDNAGGIYLPDRLHQVRIAVKKLRYVLEVARDLSRSRASARIRTLKTVQDLLGHMHDLEMLIMRIRALQGSDRAPTLRVSAELDRLVRRLETECRQLHVRYMGFKKKLLELCDYVTSADDRPASAA
ncbi:MAG TPA: CHAD domain-containing protein [Vicinamibacterales bacterium]|nr:CHAD domain-containing protein [Vicinamibacterales bacterium]